MTNKKKLTILFDLDGTLTDPKPGVTRSLQYALKQMKQPVPAAEDLLWCIGPPLQISFQKLLDSPDSRQIALAVGFYRERFKDKGTLENKVYPGIPAALERLKAQGFRLFVATSKPHVYANQILAHFKLAHYFDYIYGSELDGTRNDKGELIAHILSEQKLSPLETLMVGDRSYDIEGAGKNNVTALGVSYGYGTPQELSQSGAKFIVEFPEQIPAACDVWREED